MKERLNILPVAETINGKQRWFVHHIIPGTINEIDQLFISCFGDAVTKKTTFTILKPKRFQLH